MFYQTFTFFSPQVKQSTIIRNKRVATWFAERLKTKDLRKLGTLKRILKPYRIITQCPASPPKQKFCGYCQKAAEKEKLNIFRTSLFCMKTIVCLKYFVNDCLWKQFFASVSNSPHILLNLTSFTIFVTL